MNPIHIQTINEEQDEITDFLILVNTSSFMVGDSSLYTPTLVKLRERFFELALKSVNQVLQS